NTHAPCYFDSIGEISCKLSFRHDILICLGLTNYRSGAASRRALGKASSEGSQRDHSRWVALLSNAADVHPLVGQSLPQPGKSPHGSRIRSNAEFGRRLEQRHSYDNTLWRSRSAGLSDAE